MTLRSIFIALALSYLAHPVSSDPIQTGHYSLYRQMEFSNICAIYEIWWPYAIKAGDAKELDHGFVALLNKELVPNIGRRFGEPKDFTESIHFYMSNRIQDKSRDKFSPIDCMAYQYYRSTEDIWNKEKIDKIILDDPDFWFGSTVTQERLAAALANETLICFAASGEWGTSCDALERE